MKRASCITVALVMLLVAACPNVTAPSGDVKQRSVMVTTNGLSVQLPWSAYPYKTLESKFTTEAITADGTMNEAIWDSVPSENIGNFQSGTSSGATGVLKSVWDGYTLYVAVEVVGDTTIINNTTLNTASATAATGLSSIRTFDNVTFCLDFWNDKIDKWEDDDGIFVVSRNGKLAYQTESEAGTFGAVHTDPARREYTNRIKAWGASETSNGYIVELAINIYGSKLANGTAFGLDVVINNSTSTTGNGVRTYWSHSAAAGSYGRDVSRDGNSDWGCIWLNGHIDSLDADFNPLPAHYNDFANNDWMLTNALRYVRANLPVSDPAPTGSYPKPAASPSKVSAWEPTSWQALVDAYDAGKALLVNGNIDNKVNFSTTTMAQVKEKALALEAALTCLQWADDPIGATRWDTEVYNVLPDPLVFKTDIFNKAPYNIAKGHVVQNMNEWRLRAAELRYMAAVYEYGPIPDPPDSQSVAVNYTAGAPVRYNRTSASAVTKVNATAESWGIVHTIHYLGSEGAAFAVRDDQDLLDDGTIPRVDNLATGGSRNTTYTLNMPNDGQLAANNLSGKIPVMLSYADNANLSHYNSRGMAQINIADTSADTANRANPWGARTGTFRSYFPFNGRGDRYEMSNTMGAVWGISRAADALELAANETLSGVKYSIQITNMGTDFNVGDIITMAYAPDDEVTLTVGWIDAADTTTAQGGTAGCTLLWVAGGQTPPQKSGTLTFVSAEDFQNQAITGRTPAGLEAKVTVIGGVSGGKIGDLLDATKLLTSGFSWQGKYAFAAALYDSRIKIAIPGASGATGTLSYRYMPLGNTYAWDTTGSAYGGEVMGDSITHQVHRTNEVIRRFLNYFKFYEKMRGIDAYGNISRGYGQRLPYDHHELIASLFPRALIENNTINDYNDGSEQDALSVQAARIVYRKLIDMGGNATTAYGQPATANDLLKFSYRGVQTGEPHGNSDGQRTQEAEYAMYYFYGKAMTAATATALNTDPFFNDVLAAGGSNSYERHYGGFRVIAPWPWAGPYYP